jgi:hypothetical protein
MDFETAADELYGVAPAEFVATRTRLAKEAGDAELRKRITGLRRPSLPAWAVNRLAREAPSEVSALLEAGAGLRAAWAGEPTAGEPTAGEPVAGDLAHWERERHRAVAEALRTAADLVARAGQPLSDAARREVEETLQAAVVDPEVAEEVRIGRLAKPHSHVGFGSLTPAPQPRPKPKPKKEKEDPRLRRRRLEVEAEEAARRAADLVKAREEWAAQLDQAQRDLTAAEERAEALRREYDAARQRTDAARKALQVVRREHDQAARTATEARRTADEATRKAERARTPDD